MGSNKRFRLCMHQTQALTLYPSQGEHRIIFSLGRDVSVLRMWKAITVWPQQLIPSGASGVSGSMTALANSVLSCLRAAEYEFVPIPGNSAPTHFQTRTSTVNQKLHVFNFRDGRKRYRKKESSSAWLFSMVQQNI